MASAVSTQLENAIDAALKNGNVQALEAFLQVDVNKETPIKCSQQFLNKLDTFVIRSLDQKDPKAATLGLSSLCRCGVNFKLTNGGQGLPALIGQGLIKKMVIWFEKCRQLWIRCGQQWDETLLTLSEDFLNALTVVHEACKEGTYKITESFLYPVGELSVDSRIYILIKKEAIRTLNFILDKIPVELKKKRKILTSQEASDIRLKLAGEILEGGDYDFQSSLMEALCRMATPAQRRELADRWFSMGHVASAFAKICDSEFETGCRKFLNMVNGMQGDKKRVYSYPCLEVYLDKFELLMPVDEQLEEFWIDFNLGSHSISFYFSSADEEEKGSHWETLCIHENEVLSYTVTEKGKSKVLQIKLSEIVVVGAVEGSSLTIHFSSSLDILQAAHNVFGHSKSKGTSVLSTSKSIMDENITQIVPESQLSLGESKKNTTPDVFQASAAPKKMAAPPKKRISEPISCISGSAGSVHCGSSLFAVKPSSTHTKGKDKPSLDMVHSHGPAPKRSDVTTTLAVSVKEQNISLAEEVVLTGDGEENSLDSNFVPDTQHRTERNTCRSSTWSKLSVSKMLVTPTQKISSLSSSVRQPHLARQQEPHPCIAHGSPVSDSSRVRQKELHSELIQRLQQGIHERTQESTTKKPVALQGKILNGDSKNRISGDLCKSSLCTPKVQHAEGNAPGTGKSRDHMMFKADFNPIKASVKASVTETLQEKITPNINTETKRPSSSKYKKDTGLANTIVKLISSRYEMNNEPKEKKNAKNKIFPLSNRSWLSTDKRDINDAVSLIKSHSKTANSSVRSRKDIFAFHVDSPLSITEGNKTVADTLASSRSTQNSSGLLDTTNKKCPLSKQKKRYVKTHLFSDTDTENASTEVSWLRASSRKSKPRITKYSKQMLTKAKAVPPHTGQLLPSSPKPVWNSTKSSCKMVKALDQPRKTLKPEAASRTPHMAVYRPKRAAAISTKSYKEPDTDDSLSEVADSPTRKRENSDHLQNTGKTNEPPLIKTKNTAKKKLASYMKPDLECVSEKLQQRKNETYSEAPEKKRKGTFSEQTTGPNYRKGECDNQSNLKKPAALKQQKLNTKNAITAQEQMKESWTSCQTSSCPSPPVIEKMRSVEMSVPTLDLTCSLLLTPRGSHLPPSPNPPCQDTPSPVMQLPKPCSTVSRKENCNLSVCGADKNRSSYKTQSIQSPSSLHFQGGQINGPSATKPLLSSTVIEMDNPPMPSPPQSPFHRDSVNYSHQNGLSKESSLSLDSLSQSSTKSSILSCRDKNSSVLLAVSRETENTPLSDQDLACCDFSGPSRKRHISLSSHSDVDEKEQRKKRKTRRQNSPRMKPRKLFQSFAADGVSRVMTSSHIGTSRWNADIADMDMDDDLELPSINVKPPNLCQHMGSELNKTFQTSGRMTELHKQCMKAVQQHVSCINMQVTKYRTERLQQVQKVLLEEINKLEQNDTELQSMEKDLTMFWKNQTMAFHSYQKQETQRNETLKKAIESTACYSLEYEEGVFTSKMCAIKNDMKSVQDRLLSEMLGEQIQSVKRGLYSLFFP
ncbi:synaptonemal complex protein 2 [Parambassis ranga]|uniref:Synaptonemal complex protein 2 n=1 Tax=Parambassis ranga TaxID=210632 RepID=A0A6P7ILX6_9TELE|nr:synaptonemal complex protein 2 [Parambassis ranga]